MRRKEAKKMMLSVQFSDAAPAVFEFERDERHKDDLWLSKEACHYNKERCQRSGRAWKRKGYDVLLNDSFDKKSSPKRGTKSLQSKLHAFLQIEEENDCIPRGIERFISGKHADDRRFTKVHCIESVVDLSTYLRRQGVKTLEEIESELCELSMKQSKCARDFARRMAIADARSVLREDGAESTAAVEDEQSVVSMESCSPPRTNKPRKSLWTMAMEVEQEKESPSPKRLAQQAQVSTPRKGLSSRALLGTTGKRISKMITGGVGGQSR